MIRGIIASFFLVAAVYGQQQCAVPTIGAINGLCPGNYTLINGNQCCAQLVGTCADKVNPATGVSDCPRMAAYCNHSAYKTLMADQCQKTCGLCSGPGTPGTCVDKLNPATGRSDCPSMAAYCNHSAYKTLMAEECPKTCCLC